MTAKYPGIPAVPAMSDTELHNFLELLLENVRLLNGSLGPQQPTTLPVYSTKAVPPNFPGGLIYVTDGPKSGETLYKGSGNIAFSDKTQWTFAGTGASIVALPWTSVTGRPANLSSLTGTEPILNSTLQTSLTSGSVVPAVSTNITGQGALATLSAVDLSTTQVINKSLANVDSTANTKLGTIATGADVTSSNTAAAITGQGALATLSAVDLSTTQVINKSLANVDSTANTKLGGIATGATVGATWGANVNSTPANLAALSGSEGIQNSRIVAGTGNRHPFSQIDAGVLGYGVIYNPSSVATTLTTAISQGITVVKTVATMTATGQTISLGTSHTYEFLVEPGEYLSVSFLAETQGTSSWRVDIGFHNSTGGVVSESAITSGSGTIAFGTLIGGFITVPANAVTGWIEFRLYGPTTGTPNFTVEGAMGRVMVTQAHQDQTILAQHSPGPGAFGTAPYGSVAPSIPTGSFTYSATTTSIAWSWTAFTIYRMDGTSIAIAAGGPYTISSLSAGANYYFYPYVADNGGTTGTVAWATNAGSGSPTSAYYTANGKAQGAIQANYAQNLGLGSLAGSTPSSGTSSGGGSVGCLHPDTLVSVDGQFIPACYLDRTRRVDTPTGPAQVRGVDRVEHSEWIEVIVNNDPTTAMTVTPSHPFYRPGGVQVRTDTLTLGMILAADGDHVVVTGLRLFYEDTRYVRVSIDEPHLFFLGRARLLTHNSTVFK